MQQKTAATTTLGSVRKDASAPSIPEMTRHERTIDFEIARAAYIVDILDARSQRAFAARNRRSAIGDPGHRG
ncbi:hypothetical protein [Caballeronia novacaledonica]|uniref:hypothetical protein n=1 Tax=Caballeronia novacaledonica TaxID=1544861 RepID=UPI0015E64DF4|nr:hypothetical protein [Caballeronia novacaledonica]